MLTTYMVNKKQALKLIVAIQRAVIAAVTLEPLNKE